MEDGHWVLKCQVLVFYSIVKWLQFILIYHVCYDVLTSGLKAGKINHETYDFWLGKYKLTVYIQVTLYLTDNV